MLYERRVRLVQQLLKMAAVDGDTIIVFGSGVWFSATDKMLLREVEQYQSYIKQRHSAPLLNATFLSGGWIECVNLETGENLDSILEGQADSSNRAYLVEDVPGDNAEVWNAVIKPYLLSGNTKVVYLGNGQDELLKKN